MMEGPGESLIIDACYYMYYDIIIGERIDNRLTYGGSPRLGW